MTVTQATEPNASYWHQDPTPMPALDRRYDELLQHGVDTVPDREALVFVPYGGQGPSRWTYAELGRDVERVARALVAWEVRRGEVVAVYAANRPEFVLLQFACSQLGAIAVPVNPLYAPDELAYVLDRAAVKVCFADAVHKDLALWDTLARIAGEVPSLRERVALAPVEGHDLDWERWVARGEEVGDDALAAARAQAQTDDIVQIEFTSGTTGRPKAVQIFSRALYNGGRCTACRAEIEDGCRYLHAMPFFHVGGSITAMASTYAVRGTQIVLPYFSPREVCAAIEREDATAAIGVPTMLIAMAVRAEEEGYAFERLRTVLTGGALVPAKVAATWIDRYDVGIANTYGMTETTGPCIQTGPSDPLERALETVGRPLPGVEVEIVEPGTETRVPIGVEGEVRFRGWGTMKGYLGDEEATAAALSQDGWMRSGDLGVLGSDGFVAITGRAKDIIIRGGENIAPKTIEDAIRKLVPDIVDVSVVGVPDEYYGEAVAAYVTLRDGATLTHEELTAALEGDVPAYRIPAHLRVVDAFPTTPSGKVQKFRLLEQFRAEAGPTSP
ncbi:AMP-binding protein [Baekduia soli]|uniref:AMP-binding protein n=1 Tax=Baekduia soli TaxID=496014 RepID=A0A5B8U6N9_9ACTN|nr:AMP-binding protein [Baekduia soli]QEC48763.1 AMP-binding protein [Baekduia soli]